MSAKRMDRRMRMTYYDEVAEAAAFLAGRLGALGPRIGIVLGSGLGAVAEAVADPLAIPYGEIPYFPQSTVEGHRGRLIAGRVNGVPVAVMQGRVHFYEGYTPQQVTFPMRVLGALGVRAAVGPGAGLRFFDMTEAYSRRLRGLAREAALEEGFALDEGVYLATPGPSFETPAEVRAFRTLGATLVGMSTVPETLVARHMGLEVLGISCVTNLAAGLGPTPLSHEEVAEAGRKVERRLAGLLMRLMPKVAAALEAEP